MNDLNELIHALHVVQDECEKHAYEKEECENCPMLVGEKCAVIDLSPCDWKINDEVYKALL